MITLVSPTFIKQRARQLKREKSLSQSQAYDEAARESGFSNYKHYLNYLENHQQPKPSIEDILKNILLKKDISKEMELAISYIKNFEIPFHDILSILKLFQYSEGDKNFIYKKLTLDKDFHDLVKPDLQYVGEKLNLMNSEIQSYLLDDFLTKEGESEIQFRHPHFMAKTISLHDLAYAIDVDTLRVNGQFDLAIKFESKVPEEYKEEPHFKDRSLFGCFVIDISRNKKIKIVHSEIGEIIDGYMYKSWFRPNVKTFPAIKCA
jgi:hypothetical protein